MAHVGRGKLAGRLRRPTPQGPVSQAKGKQTVPPRVSQMLENNCVLKQVNGTFGGEQHVQKTRPKHLLEGLLALPPGKHPQ